MENMNSTILSSDLQEVEKIIFNMALRLSFSPSQMDDEEVLSIMTPTTNFTGDVPTPKTGAVKRSLFFDDEDDVEDSYTPVCKKMRTSLRPIRRALSVGNSPIGYQHNAKNEPTDVMKAVDNLVEDADLVGDGNGSHTLPTVAGKHSDLKSISSHTLSDVIQGRYHHQINSYRIIDCRYPYEFNGGHIEGAENMYTHEQIQQLLTGRAVCNKEDKREILIFHCEFSSERGPKMLRFLRKEDRAQNQQNYPSLCYPEVYILDGGYKAFYHSQQSMCCPMSYTPMLHKDHAQDLRHFRSKSKSWTAGEKRKQAKRLRV